LLLFRRPLPGPDLVISTGGLGPTSDDLTNEALGQATGREMIEYPEARRHIDEMFHHFTGRRAPSSAYKQALFPKGSKLIANPLGTAMGTFLELDEVLFAALPGVPAEMHSMFDETLESIIRERSEGVIVSMMLILGMPARVPAVGATFALRLISLLVYPYAG
jgi:nicotinamide-nucleotide amidase